MKLDTFRVRNYRSINDSGDISVSRITALLGRNESGKSNLLRALHSLNPVDGFKPLSSIKDFPRHRRLEECAENTEVIESVWALEDDERAELLKILPRATEVTKVVVQRTYQGTSREVHFPELGDITIDETEVRSKFKKVAAAVRAVAANQETATPLETAADAFEAAMVATTVQMSWAPAAMQATKNLRTALAGADAELTEKQESVLVELEALAEAILHDKDARAAAMSWVNGAIPRLILVDEYPELTGHQDIPAYLQRKSQNQLNEADKNFEKLCKVAGLNPAELQSLLDQGDHETRNQLVNRASAVVTSEIRRLWKDRSLKIRFNLDGRFIETVISDPTSTYDVEVNLGDRSRGFQWFFAFYITFSADTDGGHAENAVLLLDEPGLYLHAKSQSDLLHHFEVDFTNQILYTTHSPFMVPTQALDSVRTVNIAEETGTTVTNDPSGDARTLFPLQAALGYNLAQSLFVGPNNLVIEGVTDFWILSAVSAYLAEKGRTALSTDLTLTPAGGAQKVSYMVALLTSEALNVVVLLDSEKASKATKEELLRAKLIRDNNVVFVAEAISPSPSEADIEDLLDPVVYEGLVRESYSAELKGKVLTLNDRVPRIARRVEQALEELGIVFHKTRPTRLFLKRVATEPDKALTEQTVKQFEKLFEIVNSRLQAHVERNEKPFGS
ncbi:AAA family ATPase [Burkholderia pseudomallei]|uniref:AAA family ATPase n=1 Tax=Burkholderia pseudomallei TaxID=28450 RepID=UPI0005E399AA|nr:AAA family ATPase [Burkholderia pseudomallei]MBY7654635.1 AAA family ATPase [Burkholderia pseudomallei]QUN84256.1 AAA family ATPase [Burkholderia pseudomallei]QUN89206.1 AAA family ATPase [Burkholderia pseudomallei]QUN96122.1 AAA family ATPase [Burkholderia pseudomallei]QUO02153.1 AAA family ATPase [Burkholderia pseudomallei]